MRKTFEFVKVGGVWFYWWPDFDGDPGELAMVGGADDLLDSLDDRFGVRLAQFLTQEQLEKIGFKWNSDEPYPEPKEWTRENILSQLKEDVEFGFEKALDKRGISASLMFAVVLRWNRVLEEGLEDYPEDNYAMYLPLFKATAEKYGWENPIGDDSGSEDYYNEEYDEGLYCD